MEKLLIIDFFNLMHRAFHAYPKDFKNSRGEPTGAVYGFFVLLLNYIKKTTPTHILIAYEDDEVPTFRSTAYTGYKANRTWAEDHKEESEAFYLQVPVALKILDTLNFKVTKVNGFEADDVAGTFATKVNKNVQVLILSNDQDLLQVVSQNVSVLRPARPPFVKEKIFNPAEVQKTYGFTPIQLIDYKALRGDPSDNIKGVKGIGEVSAKKLIAEFGSVENIYKNISQISSKKIQTLLANNYEEALMSKKLATIETNVPMEVDINKCKISYVQNPKTKELFEEYEFKSLLKKLEELFPIIKESEADYTQSLFKY